MRVVEADLCPASGYDLGFPPWKENSASDEICPCCYIQFGYDDGNVRDESGRALVYAKWRRRWIEKGMKWNGKGRKHPEGWNPVAQLQRIGVQL